MHIWKHLAALAAAVALTALATVAITGHARPAQAEQDTTTQDQPDGDQPPPTSSAPDTAGEVVGNAFAGGEAQLHLVPIAPCRIADTRKAGGTLSVDSSRGFHVRGTSFGAQGGDDCSIPADSPAVEATITVIPTGSGFLRAYPGDGAPLATFMNYSTVLNVSNTGTLALRTCFTQCTFEDDLRLRAYGNPTHAVIEVNGYYTPPLAADVESNGTILESSGVYDVNRLAAGQYEVLFRRDVDECVYSATVDSSSSTGGLAMADKRSGRTDGVYVETRNPSGSLVDAEFHLVVTC